ncbi:MAG: DNA polymerase III subunit beta [Gallionella sp.]|nr:DNA polymerase III subunit beta [Gallionella sp.]
MFITKTDKQNLLKPLQIVNGIVERKHTLPILSNVLIEKNSHSIRFTATDLEIQISTTIAIEAHDEADAAITVSGKKLQEILRILPEPSQISIDLVDNKALIKANKSRFSVQTLPAEDFPVLNSALDNAIKITLSQGKLKALLHSVQYAMAQQDVRYYLNGVLLIVDQNKLKAVATDGHRLAYNTTDIVGEYPKQDIIVPRKAVLEIYKLLNDNDEPVYMEFSAQQVKFNFSDITLVSKVIDGRFPDYERVIPKYINHLNLNRIQLQQALQRVAILSNEKFRGVRLVLTDNNLSIISSNSEQEEAQEEIETDYQGNALDIGFNVNYLMDGLSNISSDAAVFSFGDMNSSVLMTSPADAEFRYVIMPMRL